MKSFVKYPLTNKIHAETVIQRLGDPVGVFQDKATFANTFMAQYPRGKGTSGNDTIQELYAACHTLVAIISKGPKYAYRVTSGFAFHKLSATQKKVILSINAADWNSAPIHHATLDSLFVLDIVAMDHNGRYTLTDLGLAVQTALKQAEIAQAQHKARAAIQPSCHGGRYMVSINSIKDAVVINVADIEEARSIQETVVKALRAKI